MPDTVASWRPPYAYIPGENDRHPEDLFDWIKDGSLPFEGAAWSYGLEFLYARFYWEAHEVLEVVWLECAPNSPKKLLTQAVIQWANAGLKFRMGRQKAGQRLCDIAEALYGELELRDLGRTNRPSEAEIARIRSLILSEKNAL